MVYAGLHGHRRHYFVALFTLGPFWDTQIAVVNTLGPFSVREAFWNSIFLLFAVVAPLASMDAATSTGLLYVWYSSRWLSRSTPAAPSSSFPLVFACSSPKTVVKLVVLFYPTHLSMCSWCSSISILYILSLWSWLFWSIDPVQIDSIVASSFLSLFCWCCGLGILGLAWFGLPPWSELLTSTLLTFLPSRTLRAFGKFSRSMVIYVR